MELFCIDFFSDSSSLYFYSALLQANAAILSIVGVFIIFRVQSLQQSIETIKMYLYEHYKGNSHFVWEFENYNMDEKKKYIKKNISNTAVTLKESLSTWLQRDEQIKKIKSSIKSPIILLAAGIGINSCALSVANFLHKFGTIVEGCIMLLVLFLEVIIIILVTKAILGAID